MWIDILTKKLQIVGSYAHELVLDLSQLRCLLYLCVLRVLHSLLDLIVKISCDIFACDLDIGTRLFFGVLSLLNACLFCLFCWSRLASILSHIHSIINFSNPHVLPFLSSSKRRPTRNPHAAINRYRAEGTTSGNSRVWGKVCDLCSCS